MAPVAVFTAEANLLVATKRTVARPFSKKASLITLRKPLSWKPLRSSGEDKEVETDVKTAQEPASADGTFYNDERPLKPKDDMSPEFKKKLRDEYLSLGGSPNTAMGSNYFLWIIVIVSVLAVLSWALGYI
ncbi:g2079 [Coccomyxa elongata]